MKAIYVRENGGPHVMRLEELPTPVTGPEQVRVRVHAAGVNPVDTYIRAGTQGRAPALPYTPGSDGAGVVEEVGASVTTFAAGDRVYFSGTAVSPFGGAYAEQTVCTASQVHPLPARLSFAQGAGIGVPYGTAFRALFDRAQARPGETVLVHGGSGGVGIAAIQLGRARGLTMLATSGTERGRALILAQGAAHAFDHASASAILEATGGRGVDVIIEMLANVNLDRDLGLLAPRGRVVVVGNRGRIEIDARQAMVRDAAILGMLLGNTPPGEVARIHNELAPGLTAGTLTPVVGQEFALADAPAAHEAVMRPGAFGKVVLTM